jgi:hypothetical protein
MSQTAPLKRILLSLAEVSLRVAWLNEALPRWPTPDAARLLNALCEENERGDPNAREVLLPLCLLLARIPHDPMVDRLREQAKAQSSFALERLLRLPQEAPMRALSERPVPDYGQGRELTLGERRSLARRPDRRAFEKLLDDPDPLVMRQLFKNPKLTEDDVVRLVARRPARCEALQELVRTEWLSRSRVRMTLLLNPGSPASLAMPLLALCTRSELLEVLRGVDTSPVLRATAHELVERRPPLGSQGEPTLQ